MSKTEMKTLAYNLRCFVTSALREYGVVFIKKNCHVSSVNLAELGEENTVHIQSLSFRNENDFPLKLVVSSRPEISMNFSRNLLFL